MRKKKLKYIIIFVKIVKIYLLFVLLVSILLIIHGEINEKILLKALIIAIFMIVYKSIAKFVGIFQGRDHATYYIVKEKVKEKNEKIKEKIKNLINSSFCQKYPVIFEIVFWLFLLIPWNWPNYFLTWIFKVQYDIIVLIASNRDIYYKKRGINKTLTSWSLYGRKYSYIYEWVVVYPIFRLLLIPDKIRTKIFAYNSIKDLIKIRIIVILYIIIYSYIGYYEYVGQMHWAYKMIGIYILLAVIWPIWIRIQVEWIKYRERRYLKPNLSLFIRLNDNSISKHLFYLFLMSMRYNIYLQKKYKFEENYGPHSVMYTRKIYSYCEGYDQSFLEKKEMWKYEKTYGISFVVYKKLICKHYCEQLYYDYLFIYEKGLEVLGEERMKKYQSSLEQLKEFYRCVVFLTMDMKRLMGYGKEEWKVKPKEESVYWIDWKIASIYKKRLEKMLYEVVPSKYIWSMKLYNKLIYNEYFLELIFSKGIELIGRENLNLAKKCLIFELARNDGYELEDLVDKYYSKGISEWETQEKDIQKCIQITHVYLGTKVNVEVTKKVVGEEINYEFFEKLSNELEREYSKIYEKIKDDELVAENFIKEYYVKYYKN